MSLSLKSGGSLYGLNVDLNLNGLATAAEGHTLYRSDVAIVASPCQRDVAFRRHDVVGGIKIQPSRVGEKHGHPGMRRLSALHLRPASHVAADIARRKSVRTQNANHHVSKVLTNAFLLAKN